MSFLHNTRLVFSGRFQADVSTVNNDVRHFDNATFVRGFQEFQATREVWNGWWNPTGSGAFRLLGCRATAVHYGDGTSTADPADDPAVGMRIAGSDDRTSGKIVDIDPQWQLASELWGLEVRLTDGTEPGLFAGFYEPHAFRDLWFGRMTGARGDSGAAATFQSVLKRVSWANDLKNSRFLAELQKAATATGELSIRLATFSLVQDSKAADFTLGTVVGVIGPRLPGEPESFVLGRRFAPATGTASWNGCSYFSARVDNDGKKLFLDLSNALQLLAPPAPVGVINDIGALTVGILKDPSVREFAPATEANFVPIGAIDYRQPGWLQATSGIFVAPLDDAQLGLLVDHPLALAALAPLDAGSGANGKFGQIAIRETVDGLFLDAERIVHRIDAPGSSDADIYAARYGAPYANTEVAISQLGRMPNQGGGQSGGPNAPQAPIPDIGVPTDRFVIPPSVTTDGNGRAKLTLTAQDPETPRRYLDGQIYLVDFRLPGQGNEARSRFDYIVAHVRDAFPVPSNPTWEDVQPILVQYGNLYPIMSRQIVDLGSQADVDRQAVLLRHAFSLRIENPNYMPVTRDLSEAKRKTIIAYLDRVIAPAVGSVPSAVSEAGPRMQPERIERPQAPIAHPGGKVTAASAFSRAIGFPSPE